MNNTEDAIAIIGLAGRFPQANDIEAFWALIKNGREAVVNFSDEELLASGVDPALLQHPDYVKSGTVIPNIADFDADFFNMSARDAEITDPQQRLFMECAWQALEQAGYPPTTTDVPIGLYAGVSDNSYLQHCLEPNMETLRATVGEYRLFTLSGKDFIATRTAYKLNLTGPAITVQTACSTSLVAVHIACQSLLNMECDMSLAGGASIIIPQERGYLYQEGMIMSPDGHCRVFDAKAQGTMGGGGVGIVLLKRLDEALADGDNVHAIIRSSAINNDGADKIGYTAPSVKGQNDVIVEAHSVAAIHPDEISYIEAHGTATPLGDPIEIQALTQAFRTNTQRKNYCAIGSVKTNIGHADAAAGIAGLIKTVLALQHRQLPPSLHYEHPNPQIDFANSPFFVNQKLVDWENKLDTPRCAGVSSFGVGGTNAHVILQEAPEIKTTIATSRPAQLLLFSAKTPNALDATIHNLQAHLQQHPKQALADIAYTLNRGRQAFTHRCLLVCTDHAEAIQQLTLPTGLASHIVGENKPRIAFMFPGQGSQYAGMTQGLYQTEPVFRAVIDECNDLLYPHLGLNIREVLYHSNAQFDIEQTNLTQPALFVVEYALAKLWMNWGIQPTALIGHSIGEYVAACIAGVFSLQSALKLVTKRAKLIQSLPKGDMLAVFISAKKAQKWCSDDISLAVINGEQRCVLAGTPEAISQLQIDLYEQGIESKPLQTSHAFHSHLLEPVLKTFTAYVQQINFQAPHIPYLSNFTGDWISEQEATDPIYWVKHLRHTVQFADNLTHLFQFEMDILLEVGPKRVLSTFARQHAACLNTCVTLQTLPSTQEVASLLETRQLLQTLGQLWLYGTNINWKQVYTNENRRRVPLPTYPFQRQRYWIEPPNQEKQPNNIEFVPAITDHSSSIDITSTLTGLEQQISDIWVQSLGIQKLSVNDDFFSLGGDSLLATQLLARLRETFNVKLGSHSLLQAPTVTQLAALIQSCLPVNNEVKTANKQTELPDLLVLIQKGNPSRTPLILLYPVGGHVYFYRELAQYLAPELPIYAIRAQGSEGEAPLLTHMEDMAEISLQTIQAFQPNGPYRLAGASFGGILAYEVAQKLIAMGEKVNFLGMIDAPGPGYMPTLLADKVEIMFYLLKVGEKIELTMDDLRKLDEEEQLTYFLRLSKQKNTPDARFDLKLTLDLFQLNMEAMLDYTATPYDGKIHFYLAQEHAEFTAHTPEQAWIPLAKGGIEIHTIPGDHISMNIEPNIKQLAYWIQKNLNQN